MEYTTLGNSELKDSRLCMGGCPMGGYGWGKVQETELIEAVHAAMDGGINFFDTADTYGLGQSEITLSKALGKNRNSVIISDKFGVRVGNGRTVYDNSPKYIIEALNKSLKRLNTDYIDLYHVHYKDDNTPWEDVFGTLDLLKKEGKIRYYGVSNVNSAVIDDIKPFADRIVSIQNEYSLACRKNEEDIIRFSSEFGFTPLTWGSLGQGILTGKYDKDVVFDSDDRRSRDVYVNFHGEKLLKNLAIVDMMKPIAEKHSKPVGAVAIRFIMDWLKDSVVLVGAKRATQIEDNIKGVDWKLDDSELVVLDEVSKD